MVEIYMPLSFLLGLVVFAFLVVILGICICAVIYEANLPKPTDTRTEEIRAYGQQVRATVDTLTEEHKQKLTHVHDEAKRTRKMKLTPEEVGRMTR